MWLGRKWEEIYQNYRNINRLSSQYCTHRLLSLTYQFSMILKIDFHSFADECKKNFLLHQKKWEQELLCCKQIRPRSWMIKRETSWARKIQFVLDLFAEPFSYRNSISGESLYRVRANINGRKSQKAIESSTTIFHRKKWEKKTFCSLWTKRWTIEWKMRE